MKPSAASTSIARNQTPGKLRIASGSVAAKDPEFLDGIARTMSNAVGPGTPGTWDLGYGCQ